MVLGATFATSAHADQKIGLLGDITGGVAALAPEMMKAYDLALKQVNDQGGVLAGEKLVGSIQDSGCNPQIAADAAGKAVNVAGVIGVVGPWCSGGVIAAANSVTIPAGITLITPSGTSPAITTLKDNDTVFRAIASDEYQGQVLARAILERGFKTIAVSFINNDYGQGFAAAFKKEYEAKGGKIAAFAGHEENKPSYRSDLAELAKSGADTLLLIDYGATSGLTIMRESLENGFFKHYFGGEGLKDAGFVDGIGAANLGDLLISSPVANKSHSLDLFNAAFKAAGGNPDGTFVTNAYDAVFLMALAVEKAGGKKELISKSLRAISSGKGEPIEAGEWKKAKELIDAGKDIDYKGATGDLVFDANGDVAGAYALYKVNGKDFDLVQQMK
ncbi:MAG: ABC transporter substrate-binding protein [Mesorhizobium sp.]|nr:ABC transporter substrate-binding protein [Mesorhizobium sp.]